MEVGLGTHNLPTISCPGITKYLNIISSKTHTYKNILYTLCPIMMDSKVLIVSTIMKELPLTHFGQMEDEVLG